MNTWSNRGQETRLFHITHLDNLPAILNKGSLLSDKIMQDRPGAQVIGHGHMKARRLFEYRVACTENRFVGEFVPFYYCPRPPMLFSINRGQTGLKPGCQGDIVHFFARSDRSPVLSLPALAGQADDAGNGAAAGAVVGDHAARHAQTLGGGL